MNTSETKAEVESLLKKSAARIQCCDLSGKIETLFAAIKHGDSAHQSWLEAAIKAHFAGLPMPEYVESKPPQMGSSSKLAADVSSLEKGALLCDRNGHKGDAAQIRELIDSICKGANYPIQRDLIVDVFRRWWFNNIDDAHFFNEMVKLLPLTVKELNAEPLPQDLLTTPKLMCSNCSTSRAPNEDGKCWKCQGELFKPVREWEEPPCYDVEMIRLIARGMGYAIAEHGSKERDQDLIAIPWSNEACSASELVRYIAKHLEGRVVETEDKPNGRFSATIQADGWFKPIDISVMGPNRHPHFYGDEMSGIPGQHGGYRSIHPSNPAVPRSDGLLRTVVYDIPHLFQPNYNYVAPRYSTPGGYPTNGAPSVVREEPTQRPDAGAVPES